MPSVRENLPSNTSQRTLFSAVGARLTAVLLVSHGAHGHGSAPGYQDENDAHGARALEKLKLNSDLSNEPGQEM